MWESVTGATMVASDFIWLRGGVRGDAQGAPESACTGNGV